MTKLTLTSFANQQPGTRTALLLASEEGTLFVDFGRSLSQTCAWSGPSPLLTAYSSLPEPSPILLSHAHDDHAGDAALLPRDAEVIAHRATRRLVESATPGATRLSWRIPSAGEVRVGPAIVRAFEVDHSVPGSLAFIIQMGGRRIAYTGDLRFHGAARAGSEAYLRELRTVRPDVLICEGTNIGEDRGESAGARSTASHLANNATEADIFFAMAELMMRRADVVCIRVSATHIERLQTVWATAVLAGRRLAIGTRHAAALLALGELDSAYDAVIHGSILIGAGREGSSSSIHERWRAHGGEVAADLLAVLDEGRSAICLSKIASALEEIASSQTRRRIEYIHSTGQPCTTAGAAHQARAAAALSALGAVVHPSLHVSGHARESDICRLVETSRAATVIPVHTSNPASFGRWHDHVIVPAYMEEIQL